MAISAVREWAIANGWTVGTRGRFSRELLEAYAKAQSGSAPRKPASRPKRAPAAKPESPSATVEIIETAAPLSSHRSRISRAERAWAKKNDWPLIDGPIENDWTVGSHITLNGRHITVGTELSIKRERGRFRFIKYVRRPDGTEWLDVWGGPKKSEQWRSFRPDRVRTVHIKRTTDRNLVAARKSNRQAALANSRAMRERNAKS